MAQTPEELKGFKKSVDSVLASYAFSTPDCIMYSFAVKYEVEKDSLVDISVSDGIDSAIGAQIAYYLKKQNFTSLYNYLGRMNKSKVAILIPVTFVMTTIDCVNPEKVEKYQWNRTFRFKGEPFFGECIMMLPVSYQASSQGHPRYERKKN